MHSLLRTVALVLALFAMLLRAAVPEGWMPGTDTGAPLMICTGVADMRGMPLHGISMHHGTPQRHTRPCFAAVAQPATSPAQAIIPAFITARYDAPRGVPALWVVATRFYRPQSPRGPPLFSSTV